jgi:HK97 family phage portal protein
MRKFNLNLPTGMLPLFHREATAPYGVPSSTSPSAPDNQKPKGGDWETNVVHPYGRSSLLIPTWTRCVTLIMQTMGQMVTQYQRMSKLGGNFVEDRYGKNAQLNYLLQVRPNPLMTASMMQEQIEYKKIYYGNAYVYIERGLDGYPVALWLCTGGGYNPLDNTYQLTYNTERGPRILVDAPAKDVLHFRNVFLTDDYYMGIPTIDYAFKTLSIAATGDEQALQDLAKGGRHKVLLQEKKDPTMGTRGRVNPQELRKTADRFGEDWQTKDVMVLDNVTDPTIISQTAQQLQLLEQRGYSDEAICRLMGCPKILAIVGDTGGNYRMPEHATQEFLLRTIQPRIREWEDEFNSKLLTASDFGQRRIHVCELALKRLDAKGQAEIDKLHLETGWSVNELRAAYDLPSIPDGDDHYVSMNLGKVGSEKLSTNASGGRPANDTNSTNANGSDGGEGGEE